MTAPFACLIACLTLNLQPQRKALRASSAWWGQTLTVIAIVAVLAGCHKRGIDLQGPLQPGEIALLSSLSPLPPLLPDPSNAFADDERAARLGLQLFFDKRLSGNGQVACANCHEPHKYLTDGHALAAGMGQTERNSPTLLGAQWLPFLFFDGRKDSQWSQALGPLENPLEHGTDRTAVFRVILGHYRPAYESIFGAIPAVLLTNLLPEHARPVHLSSKDPLQVAWDGLAVSQQAGINRVFANVGKALAAYERKLRPQPAPLDHFVAALKAGDINGGGHLPPAALRGARLFVGQAQCISCHNGPLLTDKTFHNVGLPPTPGVDPADPGRGRGASTVLGDEFRCGLPYSDTTTCEELRFLNPKFADFAGAYKTPTLRNVAMTAPYMHSGQFKTLEQVLQFYKTLPGQASVGHRELVLRLVDPDIPTADLVAFLQALTGPLPDESWLKPEP